MANLTEKFIWWDLESIKFDNGFDPLRSFEAIDSALKRIGFDGVIRNITVYAERGVFPDEITNRLQASGVHYKCVIPKSGKHIKNSQEVDVKILDDISDWETESSPPAVVVIMGCDSRYLEPLLAMQERGYQTCLMYATGNLTKQKVVEAPIPKLKWVEEVLENAPYVNPLNHELGHYRGDYNFEPVSPLITCQPCGYFVAIAIGYELKVYNLREDRPVSLKDGPLLTDSILALKFSASSQLLACGGNDKQFTVWSAKSWKCLGIINVLRGVVAVAFTHNDSHVCYATKLGCVYLLKLDGMINNGEVSCPTLVKFDNSSCIITTLGFSPNDDYMLCSNDDFNINVITFKNEPLEELHQVESYCIGHTEFITCSTFVQAQYLISGSYDGTIRLWKMPQGLLCYTLDPLMEGGHITDVCSIPNSSLVAVGVSTYSGIHLIRCDVESCLLSVTNVLHEDNFIPTSISAGEPGVWMVTGASYPPSARQSGVVRVKVVSLAERFILGDLQIGTKLNG